VFQLLGEQASFIAVAAEGEWCNPGQVVASFTVRQCALMGERVALNLAMHLSGIVPDS